MKRCGLAGAMNAMERRDRTIEDDADDVKKKKKKN